MSQPPFGFGPGGSSGDDPDIPGGGGPGTGGGGPKFFVYISRFCCIASASSFTVCGVSTTRDTTWYGRVSPCKKSITNSLGLSRITCPVHMIPFATFSGTRAATEL